MASRTMHPVHLSSSSAYQAAREPRMTEQMPRIVILILVFLLIPCMALAQGTASTSKEGTVSTPGEARALPSEFDSRKTREELVALLERPHVGFKPRLRRMSVGPTLGPCRREWRRGGDNAFPESWICLQICDLRHCGVTCASYRRRFLTRGANP